MNIKRIVLLGILSISMLFLFSPAGQAGSLWGKVSDEEWKLGPPPKYPDANAAVLFDVCSLTVRSDDITIKRYVRMKLFTKKGADEVGQVSIDYYRDDALHNVQAQTISPDGRVTKVDKKDMHTTEVGDWRSRVFAFPAMDSGCVVEYSYSNVNTRWHYIDAWNFQCSVYTFKSSYTLILGVGYSYFTVASNIPAGERNPAEGNMLDPGSSIEPLNTYTWSRVDLPPLQDEPYMGTKADFQSSISQQLVSYDHLGERYTYISSWKGLGEEFQKRVDGYCLGGDLGKLQAEITKGAANNVEKARRLYNYVAKTIQYKADPSGYRFTNDDIGKLRQIGSGTGQEKNLFLCALLKEAGIKAWPVLISTRDHGAFNPEVYHLQQFNYLLTYAQFDSSSMLMDAVSQYCPFGMLPPNKLVDGGVQVDGGDSRLVKIAPNDPKSYRVDSTNVLIDSAGVARCSTLCDFAGYFAPTLGEFHEANTPTEFFRQYFLSDLDEQASVETNTFELDTLGRCEVQAVFTMKNFVRQLDNNLVVKPVSYRFRKNPFMAAKRCYPVDFKFTQTYDNIVIYHSVRPITAATLPPDIDLSITGASYRRTSSFRDGTVRVEARLILSRDAFPPVNYSEVKRLFEAIARGQQDDLILATGI